MAKRIVKQTTLTYTHWFYEVDADTDVKAIEAVDEGMEAVGVYIGDISILSDTESSVVKEEDFMYVNRHPVGSANDTAKAPPCIGPCLYLSTVHMPESYPDFGPVRYQDTVHGYVVWYRDIEDDSCPEWLKPVMELANKHDCTIIEFDQDNDETDLLPKYDW